SPGLHLYVLRLTFYDLRSLATQTRNRARPRGTAGKEEVSPMSFRIRFLLAVTAFVTLLAAPCRAENPTISLKVENATCAQAAAQLSKAAGIPVQLYNGNVAPNDRVPANPALDAKASFDWSHVSFAQAL